MFDEKQLPFNLGDLILIEQELAFIVQKPQEVDSVTKNISGVNVLTSKGPGFLAQVLETHCVLVVNNNIIAEGIIQIISTLDNTES